MTIRELLPLEAYENESPGNLVRLAVVMGLFYGLWDPVGSWFSGERDSVFLLNQLAKGLFSGFVFGVLWFVGFRFLMRRMTRRIYQEAPSIDSPAPAGSYDYRLLCSLMLNRSTSVGGHLYIGRETWTFVPHRRNLKRHQAPLSIPAAPPPAVEAVEVPLHGLPRLVLKGPVRQVQVRTSSTTHRFATPEAEAVAARLREYLQMAA